MTTTIKEYKRLRAMGWHAQQALYSAKVREEFARLASENVVRLQIIPDDWVDMDSLKGDTFNPKVNPEIPQSKLEKEEKDFEEKVNQEGVYGIVGEYFNGEEWVNVDSVWGFVGDDWKDSGYDADVMAETIKALKGLTVCQTCHRHIKGV